MVICTHCGRQTDGSLEYCPDCGQRLKEGFTPEERERYLRDLRASTDEEKSRKKANPHEEGKPTNRQSESEGHMTINQLPFILGQQEKLVLDAPSIHYHGVGVESIGLLGGGASGGLFGGVTYSQQKKREKSMWDAQFCHAYLTNLRVVFVKAKTSFFSSDSRETKLENVISDVDIQMVQGIVSGKKGWDPTVELAVKLPDGSVNNIAFAFLVTSGKRSASGGHPRLTERDEWVRMINQCIANSRKGPASVAGDEDPLRVLKLRYAKGEITKDEYEQMRRDLA